MDKQIFVTSRKNYDFVCMMVNGYRGDFETLRKITNGRVVDDELFDFDFRNLTLSAKKVGNRAEVVGLIDVHTEDGEFYGTYTPEEIIDRAIK